MAFTSQQGPWVLTQAAKTHVATATLLLASELPKLKLTQVCLPRL